MREHMQRRLEALRGEFAAGQARLQELEAQQARLRETLLRIAGAVQVLEELLAEGPAVTGARATDEAIAASDGPRR